MLHLNGRQEEKLRKNVTKERAGNAPSLICSTYVVISRSSAEEDDNLVTRDLILIGLKSRNELRTSDSRSN